MSSITNLFINIGSNHYVNLSQVAWYIDMDDYVILSAGGRESRVRGEDAKNVLEELRRWQRVVYDV